MSSKQRKQSYEASEHVQRWLREQGTEAEQGEFNPSFLIARRDADWLLSSLAVFYQQRLITDVVAQAASGKEATVYVCEAHPATGFALVAAKIYRPRMFRSLKNDAVYREGRQQRQDGKWARPDRARRGRDSTRGRLDEVASWIRQEFVVQLAMHNAGVPVPAPLAQIGNAILMEYIGDDDGPAPRLSDTAIDPDNAAQMCDQLLDAIRLSLAHDTIHGDLSPYNVLIHDAQAYVIDYAQAVDARHGSPEDAMVLLARDVDRICAFFAAYGVRRDAVAITADLWLRYQTGGLDG